MLYPWELPKFREAVRRDPESRRYDDFVFDFRECRVGGDASAKILESAGPVAYYPPAAVFGSPPEPSCLNGVTIPKQDIEVPAVTLYALEHAQLLSQVAAIDRDGILCCPNLLHSVADVEEAIKRNRENRDGFVLTKSGDRLLAYYICAAHRRTINGTGILLHNTEPGNYGQFLLNVLPQLIYIRDHQITCDYFIHADRAPWVHAAMEVLGIPTQPIFTVREICGETLERLLILSDFFAGGLIRPYIAREISKIVDQITGGMLASPSPRKIYLSRSLNRIARPRYRHLINEITELEPLLRKSGYHILSPEVLSWRDQIRLFSGASHIIGPSGSGMLNTIFAERRAKVVDVEGFHVTVRQHARVYASTGKSYAFAFGEIDTTDDNPQRAFRNWSMPLSVLLEALDWLNASG